MSLFDELTEATGRVLRRRRAAPWSASDGPRDEVPASWSPPERW